MDSDESITSPKRSQHSILYREALGTDVSRDDIFHFIYSQLHAPDYRAAYAADLQKMLPHIETPTDRTRFDQLEAAGQQLLNLHTYYEDVEPYPITIEVKDTFNSENPET